MITNGNVDRLAILMHDHQHIKEMAKQIEIKLDCMIKDEKEAWPEEILLEIRKLAHLIAQHIQREEDLLFPLLKEMYPLDDEIADYIKEEHRQLNIQLSSLGESKETIYELISQQVEHMFKEEFALYPLIRKYLNKAIAT